jgi:hypothetical protein
MLQIPDAPEQWQPKSQLPIFQQNADVDASADTATPNQQPTQ